MQLSSEFVSGLYGGALLGASLMLALVALLTQAVKRRSRPALDTSLYSTAMGQETARLDMEQIHALISQDPGDVVRDTPPARQPAVRLVTPRRVSPLRKQSEEPEKPEDEEGWL
jgi:hypothetical protein